MKNNSEKRDWAEFYEITQNRPPSKLLVKALEYLTYKNKAIDIGGGALKDTRYLLSLGFDVTIIDQAQLMAVEAKKIKSDKLHYFITSFDKFHFPEDAFDIASAIYSLPFNPPETFDGVFENVKKSLKKDGIFCGQLFGDRDGWSKNPEMTFCTKAEAQELLKDMETISFEEEERDGTLANGTPKHWHVFHFIAKRA